MSKNFVITIGRQLGSGGKEIGEILSKRLNVPCYDKELIHLASKESGVGREFFEQMDEKTRHRLFSNVFSFRSGYMGIRSENYLSNEALFKIQSDVIKNLAEEGSCIFVGRCADYILRDHPRLLSVFISATFNDRIVRIADSENVSEKEAKLLIEQTDKKRAGYYNYYSNKTWGMASSYDLCVNSSILKIEATADFLYDFINKKIF